MGQQKGSKEPLADFSCTDQEAGREVKEGTCRSPRVPGTM